MSNPEPSRLEEFAALHAVGLLDEASQRELLDAAERDPAIAAMVRDYAETAALLAHDAPQVAPRPSLRADILRALPTSAEKSTAQPATKSNIIPFSQWIPYAIAASLMALGIVQALQITGLRRQLTTATNQLASTESDAERLRASNAFIGMRLATLEAKDASYTASKILVAWDPYQHRGVVSMQDLPAPPQGHDYQLWVLDPSAPAPISAGLITDSRPFAVKPVGTPAVGFAVSLEPAGGRPEPTGPILFAVAPGP
jgi:anti-sigma-K factor RskA